MQTGSNGGLRPVFQPGAIILGGLCAFVVTVLGSVLIGAVVALSSWQGFEAHPDWFNYAGIFIGGMYAARRAGRMGWFQGALVGVLYLIGLAALHAGGVNPQALLSALEPGALALAFVVGAVGGTFGVNL